MPTTTAKEKADKRSDQARGDVLVQGDADATLMNKGGEFAQFRAAWE
jgi:hypothetical protein